MERQIARFLIQMAKLAIFKPPLLYNRITVEISEFI